MLRPIVPRPRPAALLTAAAAVVVGLVPPAAAAAQRADSARVGAQSPRPAAADSALRPPITPRRAFLSSLLVPGWGQAALDRDIAGTIFVTAEFVSIVMIRKSLDDLRLAKAAPDSVVVGYDLGADGIVVIDPATGEPVPLREPHPLANRVRARRAHLEDWIALLIFNHFFAGADAFVAAHLWEVPARVTVDPAADGLALTVRIPW